MVGQYLMINMHFYEDLPFIPEVVVRMQSRDVSIMSTGQYRDYSTHLTGDAFDSPIIAVDVLDPNGGIIASRMPTGETYTEAMVPIDVIPDPPGIGVSLQVRMDFTEPPPFTPRLVVEFASGIRDYDFGQAPYMYTYDLYIPVSDMNSSILYMKAVNPNNGMMIGERAFSGGDSDGYDDVPFIVVPNPPISGQSVNINLETDMAVSLAPKLRIYFDSGMQEVNMGGTLPGRYFTYNIGYLNSNISKIDIVDPVTLVVKHTWTPDDFGPTSCDVVLQYYPPVVEQLLQIRAEFPGPVGFVPRVSVELDSGIKTYTFPGSAGMSIYEIFIPAGDIDSHVNQIEIWDDMNNMLLCEDIFGAAIPVYVETLTVTPALPSSTQSFQIHVEFNTPLPFIPQWRLDTAGGSYSGSFSQGAGYMVYDESVAAETFSGTPVELEIQDDMGAYISGGEIFFDSTEDFTCTALFSPDPPQPYTSLIVTAIYPSGSEPTYKPWVFIDFETVGSWEQEFSQMASMQSYSMTIPGSYITDNVIKIGVGEYPLNEIDCGDIFSIQVIDAVLTVNPDPPDPMVNLDVTATFANNAPFVPELVIEYSDATMGHYVFTGSPGQLMYQITVPKEDFNALIERIVVEDDQGHEIGDLVFGGPPPFDITSLSTTALNEINVCWTYYDWIDEYKIYFRTASGSYMDGDSPVTVGSSSCYTLGISETLVTNSTYYLKVEAFDASTFMFATPEDNITLTATSVEYPTNLWLETTAV
ncbi:MAG: hypothetical protein KAS92_00410, partial [Candidatus Omnitrophica bacterium]|nr:hypothetical protein [Candidatus Omnitrophota bacterium]